MQPVPNLWNSLELTKLVVAILTPLSVTAFGWFISRRLKRLELLHWSNQKLIEKRLSLYDSVAPLLNKLLCFYTWVGHWKDVSPSDVLKAKRELGQNFHIYRHLFDAEVFDTYEALARTLFDTFQGAGENAKIRSLIRGVDGDRTRHCTFEWQEAWSASFSPSTAAASYAEIRHRYYALMNALRASLGVPGQPRLAT